MVPTPPTFLEEPKTTFVNLLAGVTLFCRVTGNPQPSVQWRKNGVDLEEEVLETLVIDEVRLVDRGVYYCVATNTEGTETSKNAIINIDSECPYT